MLLGQSRKSRLTFAGSPRQVNGSVNGTQGGPVRPGDDRHSNRVISQLKDSQTGPNSLYQLRTFWRLREHVIPQVAWEVHLHAWQ